MQTLTQKLSVTVLAVLMALLVVMTLPGVVRAHDGEDHSDDQAATQEASTGDAQTTGNTYNYTAQSGDSYSLIARKAVQTYGIINSVNLSGSQIVAAETFLTQGAGSPEVNRGQAISLNESDIKTAVEKAQALSEAAQKLWQKYADRANFNTDNVGEARS